MRRFLAAVVLALVAVVPGGALEIGSPLVCPPGLACPVQNYPDDDPGPGRRDFACGGLTYDGHDGTDVRLPDEAAMRAGAAVVAVAGGRVTRVRDGEPDRPAGPRDRAEVAGRECGNGVVVDHGDGWETQVCHLRRGSIVVKPGDTVARGAKLGEVGLSGWTEFAHVHLTVRRNGRPVDPFTGGAVAADGACALDISASLFDPATRAALAPAPARLLAFGLAGEAPTPTALERSAVRAAAPDAPVLVAYARVLGVRAGDVERLVVTGPDGRVFAEKAETAIPDAKVHWVSFAGRRASAGAFAPGVYEVAYRLTRAGATIVEERARLELRRPLE